MLRFEKVATPLTAPTVLVPPRFPPPGFVPMATVTLLVAVVTRLPPASRISTLTAGLMGDPAGASDGWARNPSLAAAPTVMLKVPEVALVSPDAVAESRYPVPALSMLRSLNVARPLEAVSVVVPDSVPSLGLV